MQRSCICFQYRQYPVSQRLRIRGSTDFQKRSFLLRHKPGQAGVANPLFQEQNGHSGLGLTVRGTQGKHRGFRPGRRPSRTTTSFEDLFASTQREKPPLPTQSRYSKEPNIDYVATEDQDTLVKWRKDILVIGDMLDREKPTAEIWKALTSFSVFEDRTIADGKRAPRFPKTKDTSQISVLQKLLQKMISGRLNTIDRCRDPTPAEVIHKYIRSGLMREEWWETSIWSMVVTIMYSGLLDTSKRENYHFVYLMDALLQVWTLFIGQFYSSLETDPLKSLTSYDQTENLEQQSASSEERSKSINHARQDPRSLTTTTVLAFLCVKLVEKKLGLSRSTRSNAQVFSEFVDREVFNSADSITQVGSTLQPAIAVASISKNISTQLDQEWRILQDKKRDFILAEKMKEIAQTMSEGLVEKPLVLDPKKTCSRILPKGPLDSGAILKELRRATRKSDINLANSLWDRYVESMETDEVNDKDRTRAFADFLRCFVMMGDSERSIEVWNTIHKYGHKPTVQHWTSMLESCKRKRDLTSLKSIWQRMRVNGIKADNQAWTTYLSALLYCKDWKSVIGSLDQLGADWRSSAKSASAKSKQGPRDKRTQNDYFPSIIPINAIISGLLALRQQSQVVHTVLKWAQSQNVQPDVSTFNIMLRPAVRADHTEEVAHILATMKEQSCIPDIVTFTILLDGLFRNPSSNFAKETPVQQQTLIKQVFTEMETNGIRAGAHTYGLILDALLSDSSGTQNYAAAHAVLTNMAAQGVPPSPHVYTILATHYFGTNPPNLTAVDNLWRDIQREKALIDHIFYDRMIEGYSRVGEVEKMLAILRRMPKEGKTPGWIALLAVLRTLVQVQEWDLVSDLVKDVCDEKGLLRDGSRGWKGEEEFWELVRALRENGLELPKPPDKDSGRLR